MSHNVFGVRIDDISAQELGQIFDTWLSEKQGHIIVTPNAEFLLEARKNKTFKAQLNKSDLSIADSISLHYAIVALTQKQLIHRIPGVDLLPMLCEAALKKDATVLLIGGAQHSAKMAAYKLQLSAPELDIEGMDPGMIAWSQDTLTVSQMLIDSVNAIEPTVVAVGLGQVKQEQFIAQMRVQCPSVKIWIGVGGAFEMIAEVKRRAPKQFSRIGLEWLWRLFIEPSRWRRIMRATIIFPSLVAFAAIKQRTFLKSTHNVFTEIVRHFRNV